MADENEGAAVLTAAHGTTAEGVGEVFKATRQFITEHTRSAVIELVEPNTGLKTLALLDPDGGMSCLPDRVFDDVRVGPRFRRGTAAMTALDSFVAHIVRFGDTDTAVFADDRREAPKLTAVLDYNRGDTAGQHGDYRHGRHRTTFAFPLSDEWKAWVKGNGVKMPMADFALFLEDRIGDIALRGDEYPEDIARFVNVNGGAEAVADYATLIELSRGLKVYEAAQVEEATNLASGEGHIRFSVEHETRDRKGGSVKVPTMFFIAIPIFKQGPFYRIAVRLRYRKTPAGIVFGFDLYQQDRSFDHACDEAVERVRVETPAQVFFGAPEA